MDALARFQIEFTGWVNAHNKAKGYGNDPEAQLARFAERIPEDLQRQIGNAFNQGWLENEPGPNRGYFVRAAGGDPNSKGDYTLYGSDFCWELFVQLADYALVLGPAKRHGYEVQLEDHLMDITVRTGSGLLLYIENKTTAATAAKLVKDLARYADQAVPPKSGSTTKQPDYFKKAHYLLTHRPEYMAVSAIGYRKLFKVEYVGDTSFRLAEQHRGFTDVFGEHPPSQDPDRRPSMPISRLESELHRLLGERVWMNLGSGQTIYNFYASVDGQDALVIGVYESGSVWTDNSKLGEARTEALSGELEKLGIALKSEKAWTFWMRGESRLDLHDADVDVQMLATAVANVLG